MTKIDQLANLGRSAAAKAMSASQFGKTANKAVHTMQSQHPERLTGAMDSIAAQNKANILEKMKLIQKLRKEGISTTGIDGKTLDKIQNKAKEIIQTLEEPTRIPEVVAAEKLLKDPYGIEASKKAHNANIKSIFEPRFEPCGLDGKLTYTSPSLPSAQS